MKKHKIICEKGDKCITDLIIKSKQDEGYYEYIPVSGDEITVTVSDEAGTVKSQKTITVGENNVERISIDMPTDLDAGEYTYDIVLRTAEGEETETYTLCTDNIFIIKEDANNA
ncbi:MAG: DUF4469 domain-containing protein [Oscillospiraceae bacterium]|nr:DUF4469 domain-containing protein [Oscillospiraceae bacterium]